MIIKNRGKRNIQVRDHQGSRINQYELIARQYKMARTNFSYITQGQNQQQRQLNTVATLLRLLLKEVSEQKTMISQTLREDHNSTTKAELEKIKQMLQHACNYQEEGLRVQNLQNSGQQRLLEDLVEKTDRYISEDCSAYKNHMRSGSKTSPTLALLIDCEGTSHKLAEDIRSIASILGNCETQKLYGNFNQPGCAPWKLKADELGMEVVQTPSGPCGKNSADATLMVEAMDLLHKGGCDGFIIVVSDSDYTALAQRLRESDKYILGIGKYGNHKVFASLQGACNMFIDPGDLDELKHILKKSREALPLVKEALLDITTDGEWKSLENVKAKIASKNPKFKAKNYGSNRFIDLIDKIPEFEVQEKEKRAVMRMRLI